MADFYAKTGHTGPSLRATLYNPDGQAADLSDGTLTLNVYRVNGALLFSKAATIITPLEGVVRYAQAASDFTVPGLYLFEFIFWPTAGGSIPYPSDKKWVLDVSKSR
jgi:hypothetical protein